MRAASIAVLLLSAVVLSGCTDEGEDVSGGTLTSPGEGTVSLFNESFEIEAAADIQRPTITSRDVAIPGSGIVRIEADWTSTDNDIDLVVAKDDCRSGIAAWNGECTVYRIDRSSLTKPSRVDFSVTSALTVRVYVYNFSKAPETVALQALHAPSS